MAGDRSPGETSEREMFVAPDFAPVVPIRPSNVPAQRLPVLPPAPGARRLPALRIPRISGVALAKASTRALRLEADRGVGFIFVPVFLALGVIGYFSLAREPGLGALCAGFSALAAIAFLTRNRPLPQTAALMVLLVLLGMALAKIETLRAGTKVLGGEISTRLTGNVVEVENLASGRVRLTIDVTATDRPVLRYAPDRVRVSARSIPDGVEPGASVMGIVRLMPPSGPVRPDSYDFSFNSYFDGIGASGFFMKGPERVVEGGPASVSARFRASVERARNAVADRIRDTIPGAEGEIAAALVAGVRAGIPDDVNEALRRSGLYHIISISGLHMALVAGTIMGLMRGGFALFPEFSSRRPVKKYAASVALAGLAAYLFFSGADVAAQRSFIMLAVMLTALMFDRAALTMRNLAISAIAVIILSPHEVVGPSFQMSFAATAALVGAYAAWSDWRSRKPLQAPPDRSLVSSSLRKIIIIAVGLGATSLIAGGATSVYSAYHFQQVSSLGLFANLSAMPIVSIAVMPFAVLGVLMMPFGLDGPFFTIMGEGLSLTVTIARWFSERSPLDTVGLVSARAVIVLSVALLIATICTTWLRVAALPVALAGLLLLPHQSSPDLLISEDGRLVGLKIGNGRMAVNRTRPNEFTTDNWQRAFQAEIMVKPEMRAAPDSESDRDGETQTTGSAFVCADGLCLARHPSGAIVAHAVDAATAARACDTASVIIVDDATAKNICGRKRILIVTKRDLARRGSAAVTFVSPTPGTSETASSAPKRVRATVSYAIGQPYRVWHDQRRFSREARGMPPYQRKPTVAAPAAKAPVSAAP